MASVKALCDAGFSAPTIAHAPQTWRLTDPDQLFDLLADSSVRAGAALRAQDETARRAIRQALRDTVSAYRSGAGYDVPMPAVIAAASKP